MKQKGGVRGHSNTTWTNFDHFWPPPPSSGQFYLIFLKCMNYLNSLAPTSRILSNEIKTISKLVEGGEGNICTNKILGSLEILAIKKKREFVFSKLKLQLPLFKEFHWLPKVAFFFWPLLEYIILSLLSEPKCLIVLVSKWKIGLSANVGFTFVLKKMF